MKRCGCSEILPCGCCEGVEPMTPQPTANRPGLNSLFYRVGTHSTFFETMQARLSSFYLENSGLDDQNQPVTTKTYPLKGLRTRSSDDMSIALLDAAATMLDVLTFYQERIANEGYLQTATERRSILEIARLVGYSLRPGVSASVYFAYTLDDNSEPVEIPIGARAQSVPAQGELPQSFETSEKLDARTEWNDLKPRSGKAQDITIANAEYVRTIYFEGTETNLTINDPLLFVFEGQGNPILRRVETVEPLFDDKKTKVTLQLSFDNAILQFIEQYMNNFAAFCIDADDPLMIRALKSLSDFQKAVIEEENDDETEQMLKDFAQLIIDIDQSGNPGMQKWLDSLINELIATLRSFGVIDEQLNDLREGDSYEEFEEELEEFADVVGNFKKLIRILRKSDGFDDLFNEAVEVIRTLGGYVEKNLEGIVGDLGETSSVSAFTSFLNLTEPLSLPASIQPANSLVLGRDAAQVFDLQQDTLPQMVTAFNKDVGTRAYQAWANTTVTKPLPVKVFAPRTTAPLFGSTAPPRTSISQTGVVTTLGEPLVVSVTVGTLSTIFKGEEENFIHLDTSYDKIIPESWIVIDMTGIDGALVNFALNSKRLLIAKAKNVSSSVSRANYGMTGKSTRIDLGDTKWIDFVDDPALQTSPDSEFQLIRRTVVHAESEELALADQPIDDDVCGSRIELGLLYEGLRPGRWIAVSGERTDISSTGGVMASELVMLAGIEQSYDPDLPGDTVHTTLTLANKLAYTYKRETVKIYGNVVKATHGETRNEVLGSGDATQSMQAFLLKQPPLTYVSAPTPSGIASTLLVRVNDIEWDETDSLAGLQPQDRNFITKTDDEAKTTVIFGNGEQGARPPTGMENITAVYRNGIGTSGNVKAEQISLVVTKPLGVKEVINPLGASGGADAETRDQARRNVPIALMALDRLVSTRDYGDFARTFAGIGKAYATRLSDGRRRLVHLTIAGADDIPIDVNSDLYKNLRRAFSKYGDPFEPVQIAMRELLALVIIAKVRIHPEYLWEAVVEEIRAALLEAFSFDRRELGQTVYLSEVISVIQYVEGVAYVDVDVLDSISETQITDEDFLEALAFRLNPELNKKALAAAQAVVDAAVGADTAAAAAAEARTKADTFTTEPEKKFANMVATAAENEVSKSGASADTVKAAAAKQLDEIRLQIENSTRIKKCVTAKLARVETVQGTNEKKILPAQLAYLLPDVPDTLILNNLDEVKK